MRASECHSKRAKNTLIPFCALFICHIQFVICTVFLFICTVLVNLFFVYSMTMTVGWYGICSFMLLIWPPSSSLPMRFSFHLNSECVCVWVCFCMSIFAAIFSLMLFTFYGTYFISFYRYINVIFPVCKRIFQHSEQNKKTTYEIVSFWRSLCEKYHVNIYHPT